MNIRKTLDGIKCKKIYAFQINNWSCALKRLMFLWVCIKSDFLLIIVQISRIFVNLHLVQISDRNYCGF